MINRSKNTGFLIIMATIVISVILAAGVGIVAITVRELKLSRILTDSTIAFYVADSALECARMRDFKPFVSDFTYPHTTTTVTAMTPSFPYTFPKLNLSPMCGELFQERATDLTDSGNCKESASERACTYKFKYVLEGNKEADVIVIKTISRTKTVGGPADGLFAATTTIVTKGSSNASLGAVQPVTRIIDYRYSAFVVPTI